jgi:hypothetical protein
MSKVEEIERAVEQLPLSDLTELAAWIDRRRWQLETAELSKSQPTNAPSTQARLVVRDHTAFLHSYAPEDEGLYDDASTR